jgi:hypothetical protein
MHFLSRILLLRVALEEICRSSYAWLSYIEGTDDFSSMVSRIVFKTGGAYLQFILLPHEFEESCR